MQIPLEFHTRDLDADVVEKIRDLVDEQVAKLEKLAPDLVSLRVHVEQDVHHMKGGSRYRVTLRLALPPKKELIAHLEPGQRSIDDTPEGLVRVAFHALRRQLLDLRHKRAQLHEPLSSIPLSAHAGR